MPFDGVVVGMVRTVARGTVASFLWAIILSPVMAIFSMALFPPDPITLWAVYGPGIALAVLAGIISVTRSVALSQLARFAVAVYVALLVIAIPATTLFHYIRYGTLLAAGTALLLVAVNYGIAYYLSYGGVYDRLKARYQSAS